MLQIGLYLLVPFLKYENSGSSMSSQPFLTHPIFSLVKLFYLVGIHNINILIYNHNSQLFNRFFFNFQEKLFYLFIYFYIYFWPCWVFVSVRGLPLVAASGGHSSSRCAGLFTIAASLSCLNLIQYSNPFSAHSQPFYHGFAIAEFFYFEASLICYILVLGTFFTKVSKVLCF